MGSDVLSQKQKVNSLPVLGNPLLVINPFDVDSAFFGSTGMPLARNFFAPRIGTMDGIRQNNARIIYKFMFAVHAYEFSVFLLCMTRLADWTLTSL